MPKSNSIKIKLQKIKDLAKNTLDAKEEEKREFIYQKVAEAREAIKKLADEKFDSELGVLQSRFMNAESDYFGACEAEALSGKGAKHPLGTVFTRWISVYNDKNKLELVKVEEQCVYEAFTRESKHRTGRWRPDIGTFVYRRLRKNGSLGVDTLNNWEVRDSYFPEGIDPNKDKSTWR
jgi:hypothetical protein